ncbi:flagellin A [Aeromonas rivipollensis]|uniref:flagellin A n=2 Tax=Aeromonas TaxID=642 RepID=UPI0038E2E244
MSLYINTNVSSLNAQRNMMNSTKSLDTSYTRLASGLRINSAKDDAAGLQISNRLTSQINGLDQGNRNANDGISVAQTAEGAMDEVTSMLQRMRTLAQQSANGSNNTDDRTALQQEYSQLMTEIDRVAQDTTFGGKNLLKGGYVGTFQVGADAGQTITFKITSALSISGIAGTTTSKATVSSTGISAGTDRYKVSVGSGPVQVADMNNIKTASAAQSAMANLDFMIKVVDSKRADLGAVQNRFDSTIRNQANISENVNAARSRIRDADFAVETANMTKQNILQQAASTILSQANQRPQSALSLLQG